jgi:hypothetical protein
VCTASVETHTANKNLEQSNDINKMQARNYNLWKDFTSWCQILHDKYSGNDVWMLQHNKIIQKAMEKVTCHACLQPSQGHDRKLKHLEL